MQLGVVLVALTLPGLTSAPDGAGAQTQTQAPAANSPWEPDRLLPGQGFWTRTIPLRADADGPVRATLVRRPLERDRQHACAVLYIHGYVDYFLQPHLADYFAHAPMPAPMEPGCDFFALDLRRYGRSLDASEPYPNYAGNLDDYFEEIDAALDVISRDGYPFVLLNGHSTGALTAVRYLQDGARRAQVTAAFLNSPFLEFNARDLSAVTRRLAGTLGWLFPHGNVRSTVPAWYARSLLQPSECPDCHGHWTFSQALKPIEGFPVYFGWLRAVLRAQERARQGGITQPILVLHSARSNRGDGSVWRPEFGRADLVLDVTDIARDGPKIGTRVTMTSIEGGLHDLALSDPDAQARTFDAVSAWLSGMRSK